MPVIHVQLTAGAFDDTEKQAMIEKLTEAMVSVQGEALRPVTSTAPAGLLVPPPYVF